MKFGKLLAHTLIDVPDWPQIRYKEFKRRLNKRQTVERQHSLFATGEFKRALREDLQRINTFWLTKEAAFHETPPEPEAVQLLQFEPLSVLDHRFLLLRSLHLGRLVLR